MSEWIENVKLPRGYLEILVTDTKTGEIIRQEGGPNQIQDWAKHSLAFLQAGRPFCTWGNHGEAVSIGIGAPIQIAHYKDGTDGTGANDIVTSSPWTYSSAFEGLIQVRDLNSEDPSPTTTNGAPLYPFFPTKMRFGTGGLDANQNPRVDILTSAKTLQAVDESYPYVLVERERASNDPHILIGASGDVETYNKVTFSCRIPGGDSSYPYNGLVISEAGLFCDAAIKVGSDVESMRTGLMFAYRTFYGITKNESIDVTFRWSFLF